MGLIWGTNTYLSPMPSKEAKLEPKTTLVTARKTSGILPISQSSTGYFSISNNRLLLPRKNSLAPEDIRLDLMALTSWEARQHILEKAASRTFEKITRLWWGLVHKKQSVLSNDQFAFSYVGSMIYEVQWRVLEEACVSKWQSDEHTENKQEEGLGKSQPLLLLEADPAVSLYL